MTQNLSDIDCWRRRLTYRSWHRGTKELDLLFGPFADALIADFDEVELDQFDKLLLAPDPDVYDWIIGRAAPDIEYDTPVLVKIIAFHDQRHA
ncbi:MAG: succinate dehydrogenase assembly factor 2 [Rhodospirillaceae bacterium]|nr:succinate dehydrogenase assembly factor 2 [Rhodospirillaceae bacterium]